MDISGLFFNTTLPITLATYLTNLQAEDRIVFIRDDAIATLQMTRGTFLKAAARLQRRHTLFNPRH